MPGVHACIWFMRERRATRAHGAARLAANRDGKSRAARTPTRHSRRAPPRTLFHGPSFSAGILLGAIAVLLGAYAPELLNEHAIAPPNATVEAAPSMQFEFHDILASSKVDADASVYEPPPKAGPPAPAPDPNTATPAEAAAIPAAIFIQAASFRDVDDAETLRARLLLQDLPVNMARVEIESGTWYRITIGPFANRTDADRVMTRLREQNLAAIFI